MPLYLQVVLGYNALDTGIKMLPVSVVMFVAAIVDDYSQAQIQVLKVGLLVAAILALVSLPFTWGLPHVLL
ncbi:MAG: hypothetical protein LH645_05775 [Actinomycetia bacterium]|nr:hypothetical protein [Actinomycetes bacterium]